MLKIERLRKNFGGQPVLNDLSLDIAPGEVYGLLGPNGAGKTTTINIVCNLLRADSGSVYINGQTISERHKRIIGVAPQENLLYRSLTCTENLDFFASLYGLSGRQKRQQIRSCLASVGLTQQADRPADALSGGMQRRLNLAIALVHQPKLLILDEPTTGLDIESRYELWDLIKQQQSQGITILLTTHLLDEAERLCQRIGILKQGQLVAEGTLAELRQLIPAQEIVLIQTPAPERAIARAQELGFTHRYYGNDLAFWLPQSLDLKQVLTYFDGVAIDSVSRQPVRLEHVYLEVTRTKE